MKKILNIAIISIIFTLWFYSPRVQVFTEKLFNSVQICNNTTYTISYYERKAFSNPYKNVFFSDILPGTCSEFKASYWIDNKAITTIRTLENGETYIYQNSPVDPSSYKKTQMGKNTININQLVKSEINIQSGWKIISTFTNN